ncbi:PTS system mannose/fructose/sorbose family transporter subunit IID [Mycoplasmopsis fermentans]|nr:PTS system mannose/fructose/sorbose family transporter subunit IID [Mycoplasmopsis fermentans]ADN69067.1 protein-N(pi)-phosphohistidine--sugar phosphotransferase [Mycoplasmopsis fermentans JER]
MKITREVNKMESNNKDFVQVNQAQTKKLSIWTYIIVALRSYFLQSGFNYANFQGLGYANIIYPALKKIYGYGTQQFKDALLNNIEFYNTNPQCIPLITSIHIQLLNNGTSWADARTIKMSLMGPLSGIGDSLTQYAIYPLFSVIAIGFAQSGNILGPIIFIVGMNITLITIRLTLGILGYKLGEVAIAKLSKHMQSIIKIASMLGVTIISALALRLTKVKFTLQFSQRVDAGASGFQEQVISIQNILDNIMPLFASGIWVIFIYFMVTKYKWSPYKVIVVTILVGVTAGVFGILGV